MRNETRSEAIANDQIAQYALIAKRCPVQQRPRPTQRKEDHFVGVAVVVLFIVSAVIAVIIN